jgi:histidine triad (HIT) family protein
MEPLMKRCIFCDIVSGQGDASIVYRDDACIAFMDIQPVTTGHVLVIPLEHATNLSELPTGTGEHIFKVAQQTAAAVRESPIRCEGVNLFLADGAAAGQDVFHVHLHVIPRYAGDGFRLIRPPDSHGIRPRIELDIAAEQIRLAIET